MSPDEAIGKLFAGLERTGSLEAALTDSVRLACESAACQAGAVLTDVDATAAPSYWFRHDPHGLLEQLACDGAGPGVSASVGDDRSGAMSCAGASLRKLHIPLRCAGRQVGRLILLAPPQAGDEQVKSRTARIDAVLAVLIAAAEHSAAQPLSGVLSRAAFRARVIAEISRSQRCDDQLSVLHMKVAGVQRTTSDNKSGPWSGVALLGETLAPRLRASDAVGLMAPDRLAVLLTGTGRLGARIAARRIEQLLRVPENGSLSRLDLTFAPPNFCLRTFPEDGNDVDGLCAVSGWSCGTIAPAAAVSPT